MEKFDWSIINQSGERLLDILRKAFGTLFPLDFGIKYDHSIGKLFSFDLRKPELDSLLFSGAIGIFLRPPKSTR